MVFHVSFEYFEIKMTSNEYKLIIEMLFIVCYVQSLVYFQMIAISYFDPEIFIDKEK